MLEKILIKKQLISYIKENKRFPFWYISSEQKARSLSLLEIILRNLTVLDKEIYQHVRHKTSFKIVNILRIASAEILFDKIPTHAAVDCAVRLTKLDKKLLRFSGLVNVVCRKISKKLLDGSSLDDPLLCNELLIGLKNIYDFETLKRFSLAQQKRPPLDLTIKDVNRENYYADLLEGCLLPSGTVRLQHQNQLTKMSGYEEGDWWVQDFSSSIPVKLLGPVFGLSVFDVCAAPGGKTLQLASGGAQVTALEISKKRARKLRENLSRTKLSADIIIDDIHKIEVKNLFDIVLVDAPCSATGTIRKNCDLQYLNPHKRVDSLVTMQKAIIKKAMCFVKPGGRLLYCTCSLLPSEGEEVISQSIRYSSDWSQAIISGENLGINPEWVDRCWGLRLRPDFWQSIGGMDGFYIAMLIRKLTV